MDNVLLSPHNMVGRLDWLGCGGNARRKEGRDQAMVLHLYPTNQIHPTKSTQKINQSTTNILQDQTATFLFQSAAFFAENCGRFVKGLALRNLVDKKAGY